MPLLQFELPTLAEEEANGLYVETGSGLSDGTGFNKGSRDTGGVLNGRGSGRGSGDGEGWALWRSGIGWGSGDGDGDGYDGGSGEG